ncbi:family transcriptional regulator [Stemphylium lycopersici]|uniref:Family transcriptional regulator n=1 Tax=Stemphylium lycopersici TaxID=183478 RepID=A0A364NG41_STELY|nr:family transcriptional regulator [Stemphylium lycopersici]
MSRLITVFGATGNQGGSVIKHILADAALSKEFKIRGITRDVSKPAAQALVKQGVDMQKADLSSKSSLADVIRGAHSVFLVTNYWESANSDVELSQGKNAIDVAKQEGHNSDLILLGRLSHVPHFDSKAEIEEYARQSGISSTFYLPGYFMSNYTQMIQKGENGSLTLALPVGKNSKFPLIDIAEDTGKYVKAIIKNRERLNGARIYGAVDYYTAERVLAELEEVTGKKTNYVQVSAETYKGFFPEFMAQEMLENHLFIEEPGYYNGADLADSLALLEEKPVTWKEFVSKSGAF